MDWRPEVKPSLICHYTELDRLQESSFDGIWSGYGLNRIPAQDVPRLLRDWCRLIKEDGKVVVCVTNVRKLGEMAYKQGWDRSRDRENLAPKDWWYGDPGQLGLPIRSGYSSSTLAKAFSEAGFTEVEVKANGPQLVLAATRVPREGSPRIAIREEDVNKMMQDRDRLDQPPQMNVRYP